MWSNGAPRHGRLVLLLASLLVMVLACRAELTLVRPGGTGQEVEPPWAEQRDLLTITSGELDGSDEVIAGAATANELISPDYPELPCNASLMNRLRHVNALQVLSGKAAVSGVIVQFDLHECQLAGREDGSCAKYTKISTECDGLLSANYTPEAREVRGNETKAIRYFHPLQQIWSRREKPCPILHLPPDRVALSMTLLTDNRLNVRLLHVPLLVSSMACWRGLTQPQQAEVTLTLSQSPTVGLAAPGLGNASAQLCQLRYSSKLDFALLGNDDPNGTSQEFAFTCCYADEPGDAVTCHQTATFSKWYSGNTAVTFWGLFVALLLGPLPFISKLSPAMSGSAKKKKKKVTPAAGGAQPNAMVHVINAGNPQPRAVAVMMPNDDDDDDDNDDANAREADAADDDDDDDDDGLSSALDMQTFSWRKMMMSIFHDDPEEEFVHNTSAATADDDDDEDDDEWDETLVMFCKNVQVVVRLRWLAIMYIPLVLIALRAVAYRVSSTNTILQCMLHLEAPTPWFLFLHNSDYALLALYIFFCFICLLANPKRVRAGLKENPDTAHDVRTTLFPTLPSGYRFPLTLKKFKATSESGPLRQGLLYHTWEVFLCHSLVWKVYRDRIRGERTQDARPWMLLCVLLAVPDGIMLVTTAALAFIYNTPVGYVVIRWSTCAGASVRGLPRHESLDKALRLSVGVAWFLAFLTVYLLLLLSATWMVATLQYTIVGIVYNGREYIDYAIAFTTFILYLLNYWRKVTGGYNDLQLSVVTQFKKAVNEEKLVKKVVEGVTDKLTAPSAAMALPLAKSDVPKTAFKKIVTEHYPVRFVVLKALLMFIAVCVYLAALNATVMLTGELEQYSGFTKSIALVIGAAVPKIAEYFSDDPAARKQLLDVQAEDSIRTELTKLAKMAKVPGLAAHL